MSIPEMCNFPETEFYTMAIQDGKYVGIKRNGLADFERGVYYEDNEQLIMSEEKWIAYDITAGVEICKERDFDRLYEKVSKMWNTIENRRNTEAYRGLKRMYESVLNEIDPLIL